LPDQLVVRGLHAGILQASQDHRIADDHARPRLPLGELGKQRDVVTDDVVTNDFIRLVESFDVVLGLVRPEANVAPRPLLYVE
jgi:hypothetical protein